jgi:hypothetical protein
MVITLLISTRDETMYQARLHPEQYSNTFSDEQVKRLHDAIMYVCDTAVGTLAESDKFPQDWLMKYRWDKGKKTGSQLPNGAKITFLKVGGRTSAIVPSVQKKTAAVAGDISDNFEDGDSEEDERAKSKRGGKRKVKDLKADTESEKDQNTTVPTRVKRGLKGNGVDIKEESRAEDEKYGAPVAKRQKGVPAKKGKTAKTDAVKVQDESGRRRSGRLLK